MTIDAPMCLAICMPSRPTPELAPWISTDSPFFSRPGADQRVVHGLDGDRHAGGLLVAHVVGRDLVGAAGIGDGVLGEAAGRRAHHPIARLEVLDVAADRLDLAGAFQADDGAGAADRAVAMARGDREIGAVERRRLAP